MKDVILVAIISIGALGALLMAMKQVFDRNRREPVEVQAIDGEDAPRCYCGSLASHPMPTLARSREDGLASKDRDMFAGAPRYHREVTDESPKALCRVHAHLADAKMDEFIYVGIRAIQADCNSKIAKEAATFEKETLPTFLEQSLTTREKRDKGKLSNAPSNGAYPATNGSNVPSPLSLS